MVSVAHPRCIHCGIWYPGLRQKLWFKIQTLGARFKVFARLLPEDMAQTATNVRLDPGDWAVERQCDYDDPPVANYLYLEALRRFKYSDSIWIGRDEEVDFVRSPLAEDQHERIYATGIGVLLVIPG